MAEAGGPATAEIHKPTGVVDRVKEGVRRLATVEGRAEAMAQKQMDAILAYVPEEKRAEAMKMLEEKRPDLVAANMPGAKDSLVKDAVIGAAVGTIALGGLVGVSIWQKDRLAGALYDMAGGVDKVGTGLGKAGKRIRKTVEGLGRGVRLWPFNKLDVNPRNVALPSA